MNFKLASYAAQAHNSAGRIHTETAPNNRTEYQRDRDRIIHSSAFRRLEYKTQVFVNHEGDMFRTRLTHSIEVAQIARSIARTLNVNEDLTEAIALAHDLGHTPFGHAGQEILNHCMQQWGGFEHNLQSLRVVDELEEKYADFPGLNLTFETREGILKHCSKAHAQKIGMLGKRFIDKTQASIEAQIANIADEIAYNNHDVDDGLRASLLSVEQLNELQLFNEQYQTVSARYPNISKRRTLHEIIRRMIDRQINDLLESSLIRIKDNKIHDINDVRSQNQPLIGFSDNMQKMTRELKHFLHTNLYQHYKVHRMSAKAKNLIETLFNTFVSDIRLLPLEHANQIRLAQKSNGENGKCRAISDYIAGMTDRYAILEFERITNPLRVT